MARDPRDKARLHAALTQLAEQDPLINVRQDDIRQEIYVSLYGEVQKQVIEATLAADYGLAAAVPGDDADLRRAARPHRHGGGDPARAGEPVPRHAGLPHRPRPAGLGHRVRARSRPSGGAAVHLQEHGELRRRACEQYVTETLRQGLHGWQVTDCTVALIRSQYSVPDGPPSTRGPLSGPQDFRKLTPLVVMAALKRAGHGGLRAGPPFPPGHPGRHAQRPAAGPGQAARGPAGIGDRATPGASWRETSR